MLIGTRPTLIDVVLMVGSRLSLELCVSPVLIAHGFLLLALQAFVFTGDKLAFIGIVAAGKAKRGKGANYQQI